MMSEQEKAAFLKAEGWKKHLQRTGIYWEDPVTPSNGPEWVQMCPFNEAYRLASRRKAQRETRQLKAAGFYFSPFANDTWDSGWFDSGHNWMARTRAEAVKRLESSPLGDRAP